MKKNSPINILLAIIIVVVVGNTVIIARLTSKISVAMDYAIEINQPAKLSAVIIKSQECDSCFDIDTSFDDIKNSNVLIETEGEIDAEDEKARELIAKYSIKNLPTIILTGETKKSAKLEDELKKIGELKDDVFIFTKLKPPYFSIAENRVLGKVAVTYINDKECQQCPTHEGFVNQLEQSGVNIVARKTIDYRNSEAQNMIEKYDITRIPTFIFDKEIEVYKNVISEWPKIGKIADDRSYIAKPISAPYRDMNTDQIRGIVSVISLIDSTCEECTDEKTIKQLLSRYNVFYGKEQVIDINSPAGQELKEKYQIINVPALILGEELSVYTILNQAWNQVGSKEQDGKYILRKLSILKGIKYKDLSSGTIISN